MNEPKPNELNKMVGKVYGNEKKNGGGDEGGGKKSSRVAKWKREG